MEESGNLTEKVERSLNHRFSLKKINKGETSDLYEDVITKNFQIISDLLKKLNALFIKQENFEKQIDSIHKKIGKFDSDLENIHAEHRRDNLYIYSSVDSLKSDLDGLDNHIRLFIQEMKEKGIEGEKLKVYNINRFQAEERPSIVINNQKQFTRLAKKSDKIDIGYQDMGPFSQNKSRAEKEAQSFHGESFEGNKTLKIPMNGSLKKENQGEYDGVILSKNENKHFEQNKKKSYKMNELRKQDFSLALNKMNGEKRLSKNYYQNEIKVPTSKNRVIKRQKVLQKELSFPNTEIALKNAKIRNYPIMEDNEIGEGYTAKLGHKRVATQPINSNRNLSKDNMQTNIRGLKNRQIAILEQLESEQRKAQENSSFVPQKEFPKKFSKKTKTILKQVNPDLQSASNDENQDSQEQSEIVQYDLVNDNEEISAEEDYQHYTLPGGFRMKNEGDFIHRKQFDKQFQKIRKKLRSLLQECVVMFANKIQTKKAVIFLDNKLNRLIGLFPDKNLAKQMQIGEYGQPTAISKCLACMRPIFIRANQDSTPLNSQKASVDKLYNIEQLKKRTREALKDKKSRPKNIRRSFN